MQNRNGEEQRTHFRSERFFVVDKAFYFSTREGNEVGPFSSKEEAELGLERYIRCVVVEGKSINTATKVALEGNWAVSFQ